MNANELNARADKHLSNMKPGSPVEIVSYGSLIRGGRHGSCPCCRFHQFMSDYERAAEIVHLYADPVYPGQSYTTIVCERCARYAQTKVQ